LVIRFPPDMAGMVEKFVTEESQASDRLTMMFNEDLRSGSVKFDQQTMPFKVYDLPTISEVYKTLDKKVVYKVADLSQMIVCAPEARNKKTRKEVRAKNIDDEEGDEVTRPTSSSTKWPHGLCAPMKNARKKKFRKVKRKRFLDQTDVERELKRILRADLEAQAVRWEIVTVDADEEDKNKKPGDNRGVAEETSERAPNVEADPGDKPATAQDSSKSDIDATLWDFDDSLSLSESSGEEGDGND